MHRKSFTSSSVQVSDVFVKSPKKAFLFQILRRNKVTGPGKSEAQWKALGVVLILFFYCSCNSREPVLSGGHQPPSRQFKPSPFSSEKNMKRVENDFVSPFCGLLPTEHVVGWQRGRGRKGAFFWNCEHVDREGETVGAGWGLFLELCRTTRASRPRRQKGPSKMFPVFCL